MRVCYALIALSGLPAGQSLGQDARFYYEGSFTGPYVELDIGEVAYVNSDADAISIDILDANAAIKATRVDANWDSYPNSSLSNYFVYTESDMPFVGGTNQYEDINIKVECMYKTDYWPHLPQPLVFVPFDISDANPNPDNDHWLDDHDDLASLVGHKVLVLRRAFLWENSEDVGGLHGPYGDVKIGAFDAALFDDPDWRNPDTAWTYHINNWSRGELPGPGWSGYMPIGYPDPYDEWFDGPFGCIYSNIALHDWGNVGSVSDTEEIAILLREADSDGNPVDVLGGRIVTAGETGAILIQLAGFGWVLAENIDVTGPEPIVSLEGNDKVFWFGGWDSQYSVNVYGPQNAAVPCESCPGHQFEPFNNSQFWNFHDNPAFNGYKVGLVGGHFPVGMYDMPRSYHVTDRPVRFGN